MVFAVHVFLQYQHAEAHKLEGIAMESSFSELMEEKAVSETYANTPIFPQGVLQGEEPQCSHEEPCGAGEEGSCTEAARERGGGSSRGGSSSSPQPGPAGREQ